MQQLAKYVFTSGNMLMPGDHVSWHTPLDLTPAQLNGTAAPTQQSTRITQILMGRDPQLPAVAPTPHGDVCRFFFSSFI